MRLPLVLAISTLASSLASSLALTAQSMVPSAKFDPAPFNKALGLDSHVHPFDKCDGAPDAVYMRSGTRYYACVNGKSVCNKDPGEIPAHLIRTFDVSRAQFAVKAKQHQADAARHRNITLHEIHLERMAAKASLVEPSTPNPVASPVAGPVATAGPSPAPIKLADEKTAAVKAGFSRDEVLQALGKPHSRVSGDYEKFSYFLQSGKTFSLEFEGGRVAQVRTVTPH